MSRICFWILLGTFCACISSDGGVQEDDEYAIVLNRSLGSFKTKVLRDPGFLFSLNPRREVDYFSMADFSIVNRIADFTYPSSRFTIGTLRNVTDGDSAYFNDEKQFYSQHEDWKPIFRDLGFPNLKEVQHVDWENVGELESNYYLFIRHPIATSKTIQCEIDVISFCDEIVLSLLLFYDRKKREVVNYNYFVEDETSMSRFKYLNDIDIDIEKCK